MIVDILNDVTIWLLLVIQFIVILINIIGGYTKYGQNCWFKLALKNAENYQKYKKNKIYVVITLLTSLFITFLINFVILFYSLSLFGENQRMLIFTIIMFALNIFDFIETRTMATHLFKKYYKIFRVEVWFTRLLVIAQIIFVVTFIKYFIS